MKTWLEALNEDMAKRAQEREAAAKAKMDKAQLRQVPMRERIKRLVRAMPPDDRNLPRPIQYFVDQLAPRWNGSRACPRDVARGLRELGWSRCRYWKGEADGFKTHWIPPESG